MPQARQETPYQETLDFLFALEADRGIDLELDRVRRALRALGSPERAFDSIHIGGTNGKGSTAALLHAVLTAQGYRTGLYTSPHLVDFRERIRVGTRSISPAEVVCLTRALRRRLEARGLQLTYFEFVTVLALCYFARSRVEIAVVEVGLGGRLDATNVLAPAAAVVTSVGLDHEGYLGQDVASIAREKGGIIKRGVPTLVGPVDEGVKRIFREIARREGAAVHFAGERFAVRIRDDGTFDYDGFGWRLAALPLSLRGSFQRSNAALALAALEQVQDRWPVQEDGVRRGLGTARWPGRLDVVGEDPLVVLDGAHNVQAVETLLRELPAVTGGRRVRLLFAVMRDKRWSEMVRLLSGIADAVVVTRVGGPRGEEPARLADAFAPAVPARAVEDPCGAFREALSRTGPGEALLVCGSLYLVGAVYPFAAAADGGHAPFFGAGLEGGGE